ncbi:MAG TPA: FAD-dependent oxidoreductase, partial [Acetobacteraceae bacterium]|nr:FAD-dependent oxidoreductase [Acetobacteraceae bacterium]
MSQVHVIGAGLSGLSAAVSLTAAGRTVVVHEAGPAAGGRARSYFDRELGLRIDNGNHLLLSGNAAAMAYIDRIGAGGTLTGPSLPVFPFLDIPSGTSWTLRPNPGRLPWWVAAPGRRVPGTRLGDYLRLAAVPRITDDRSVAEALPHGALYRRLVEPLAIAALNTPPNQGLARLLGVVLRETLMRGGAACRPCFPRQGLSETLVDPAIAWLRARGGEVRFGHRIAGLDVEAGRVTALLAPEGRLPVDAVVLAVPPWVATGLLPGLTAPDAFEAILNIHFGVPADPGEAGFIGLIGGTAEWVFVKPGHVSVTV